MTCPRCGSTSVRPSRFRLSDVPRLLLLLRPVRCHICLHRSYANLLLSLITRGKPRGGSRAAAAK
jgi:hypothetical protein